MSFLQVLNDVTTSNLQVEVSQAVRQQVCIQSDIVMTLSGAVQQHVAEEEGELI